MVIKKIVKPSGEAVYKLYNMAIVYTNFSGERFNDGKRSFDILLDDGDVEYFKKEGFFLSPFKFERKDGIKYHLNIKLKFDGKRPPHMYMYNNKVKVVINATNAGLLDAADIVSADAAIHPNEYSPGVASAWLEEFRAVIEEEYFADEYAKYDDIPEDDNGADLPF